MDTFSGLVVSAAHEGFSMQLRRLMKAHLMLMKQKRSSVIRSLQVWQPKSYRQEPSLKEKGLMSPSTGLPYGTNVPNAFDWESTDVMQH